MKIIPAIDLLDGNVVRLRKGDYEQVTVYSDDPLEVARNFRDAGFSHIHVVDLNGARNGDFANLKHIRRIVEVTGVSIQAGGGIRSFEDADMLLKQDISKIICSSMAVRSTDDWLRVLDTYYDRAILGMDLKNGEIAYAGWEETTDDSLESFLKPMLERGLLEVLCTDVSRDGTLEGPNIDLYKVLMSRFPGLNFIASGGVSNTDDLKQLKESNLDAVVVGRAYYENLLSLEEMLKFHSPLQ